MAARPRAHPAAALDTGGTGDEALVLLTEIRDGLRRLEARVGGPGGGA
jgi:hypothetical protein